MKKLFFVSLILFLLPMMVSAGEITIGPNVQIGSAFFKGTVLRIYRTSYPDNTKYVHFYLDGKSVDNDMIQPDGQYYLYTLPKNVIVKNRIYDKEATTLTVYFEEMPSDKKVHCFIDGKDPDEIQNPSGIFDKKFCTDYLELGNYYTSDDLILFYSSWANATFYVGNEFYYSINGYCNPIPKYNNKEAHWVYIDNTYNAYFNQISPVFVSYIPPKFELKCEPKTIKYGETSKCTLYGTVDSSLKNLNFDFDQKEYKVLGSSFPEGIENKEGDKQYNLEISEDFSQEENGFVLGVFEITGAKNKKYTDDVQIINLDYVDGVARAKYDTIKDPVEIIALSESYSKEIKENQEMEEEKNPDTSDISVIAPLVLFVITASIFFILNKMKKIKIVS